MEKIKILFEDNHILVAYKPKGVLSQADGKDKIDMLTYLKDYIKNKYNKPGNVYLGLVHRLDTNTDGVMVFAKTSKAAARLSDSIKNHLLKKKYKATVEGVLNNNDYITLTNYLIKDENNKIAYENKNGKEAILSFKVIKNYKIGNTDVSDILVDLKTGRFHQIRCQMALYGNPLYGDKKYGSKNTIDPNEFPLTAYHLSFPHPISKEILEFEV